VHHSGSGRLRISRRPRPLAGLGAARGGAGAGAAEEEQAEEEYNASSDGDDDDDFDFVLRLRQAALTTTYSATGCFVINGGAPDCSANNNTSLWRRRRALWCNGNRVEFLTAALNNDPPSARLSWYGFVILRRPAASRLLSVRERLRFMTADYFCWPRWRHIAP